jgi:hypothetical protein
MANFSPTCFAITAKFGKEVFTFEQSSISISDKDRRPATAKAIAIL